MNTATRSKLSQMSNIKKDVLLSTKAEKIEMTLNTDSSLASGLLIQRLTELYEDPIEASVRETVSNAFDAVTESYSGSRPEVRISKPSSLNPIMVIKDNGVGMDYDDLKEIYSKYGASTKINDLDQIGAYGLGAKAPLAYGTEFTVSSVRNGHKVTIIVAREELTNYIKIIDNVETNEPSGTTVSIPVNSRDIDKFNENISKYEVTPLDKDVDLYINETKINNEDFTILTDNALLLDGAEKVYGRIWVNQNSFTKLITNTSENEVKRHVKYLIGGWLYDSPMFRNDKYYIRRDSQIIVELKAGLVGFNSSRDAILENDRYYELEKLIVEYIKSEEFMRDITKSMNRLNIDKFKENMYALFDSQRRWVKLINDKLVVENNSTMGYYHSSIPRKFKFEDFVHNETGFTLNDLLKNIPTQKKPTVAFKETKDAWRKTGMNHIMNNNISYSGFTNRSVREINETIDKVMFENIRDIGQDNTLESLIMNLSTVVYNKPDIKITFITDVNKYVDKLKPMRKSIIRMRNNDDMDSKYDSIIVLTYHTKLEIEKMIKDLGLENVNLYIDTAEKIIDSVKKFRSNNRQKSERKTVNEKLSTKFEKYDLKSDSRHRASVNDIDKNKNNLIIISSHYVPTQRVLMMHIWYCNENNINKDDLDIYVSQGNHRVIDLNILMGFGTVMRDPESDLAGSSKLYIENIHDNVAKLNAIREDTINTSEKAMIRLFVSMAFGPETLSRSLMDKLNYTYELSKIANYEMPKFPLDKINEIRDSHKILNYGVSSWHLNIDSINHLVNKIDPKYYEEITSLIMFATNRMLVINEDADIENRVEVKHENYNYKDLDDIRSAFNDEGPKSYSKLIKLKVEAELEFTKTIIKYLNAIKII